MYNLFFINLFGFKGRSDRKQYIARVLLISFLLVICDRVVDFDDKFSNYLIFVVFTILMFIQIIPLSVRRLHDVGYSGWWSLILLLGGWGYIKLCSLNLVNINLVIPIPLGQCLIIYLMIIKGTVDVNKYGKPFDYSNKNNSTLKFDVIASVIIFLLLSSIGYFIQQKQVHKQSSLEASKVALEYYNKGNYEEALKGFNTAIDFTPNMLSLYSGRGAVLMKLNRFDEALSDYNKFIESRKCLENNCCDICDIATYKKKIHVLYKQSNYTEAIALCDLLLNIIKDTDDYIFVYLSKATILNKMESYSESLECVEKTLSLDSKNEKALKLKKELLKKN